MINTSIPLIADEEDYNRNFSDLGSEFSKLLQSDADRSLIEPIRKNPAANLNQKSTILYGDGIANQGMIFQNNYDLSDNQLLTEAQSENILDKISVNRPYTADENEMRMLQNFDLDPQIRRLLVAESTRSGNNIYAQESQDFVKQVQKDLQAFIKERDLYSLGVEPIQRLQQKLQEEELKKIREGKSDEKSNIRKVAEILTQTKRMNLKDALLAAERILETPEKEAEEKLAKKRATVEAITRQRAGVKGFEPPLEEKLIKDEL
jgi:hypothetical protein